MEAVTSIAGIALGLTAAVSQAGVPSKYKPLISIGFAVFYALITLGPSMVSVGAGIMGGLMASGLWSGTKAMTNNE